MRRVTQAAAPLLRQVTKSPLTAAAQAVTRTGHELATKAPSRRLTELSLPKEHAVVPVVASQLPAPVRVAAPSAQPRPFENRRANVQATLMVADTGLEKIIAAGAQARSEFSKAAKKFSDNHTHNTPEHQAFAERAGKAYRDFNDLLVLLQAMARPSDINVRSFHPEQVLKDATKTISKFYDYQMILRAKDLQAAHLERKGPLAEPLPFNSACKLAKVEATPFKEALTEFSSEHRRLDEVGAFSRYLQGYREHNPLIAASAADLSARR